MATFNPFNPDGTWRWEVNGKDLEDLGIKAKAAGDAANAWAKAGKKAEEPWNQWQSQKSPEELNAFNQWKQAYVKFNNMTTKPGENWFRQEWDSKEVGMWEDEMQDTFTAQMGYEERLAFRAYCEAHRYKTAREEAAAWDLHGCAEWWANKNRPDAWKELLKQAERNRQQQKQERTWESYGGRKSYRDIFDEWNRQQQQGRQRSGKQLTVELARALILSNLDKFDVHYAEYRQRQRRMQMNEAKSKIGQLSIVHVPTVAEQFNVKLWNSGGHADRETRDKIYGQLYKSEKYQPEPAIDEFVKLLMSPLFKWNQ